MPEFAPFDKFPYVALVTGANRGLGLEFVRQIVLGRDPSVKLPFGHVSPSSAELEIPSCVPSSAVCIATCRSPADAKDLVTLSEQAPGRIFIVKLEVQSDEDIEAVAAHVSREFGRLDLLIHNAGITEPSLKPRIGNSVHKEVLKVLDVNAAAPLALTVALTPVLERTIAKRLEQLQLSPLRARLPFKPDPTADGYIPKHEITAVTQRAADLVAAGPQPLSPEAKVALKASPVKVAFVSSMLGSTTVATNSWSPGYRAAKAALNAFARSIALEVRGLAVVLLHPGWVLTDMGARAGGDLPTLLPPESVAGCLQCIDRARADEVPLGIKSYDGYTWPF